MKQTKILILGACGQLGTELTEGLRAEYGAQNVIATDLNENNKAVVNAGPFEVLNALDKNGLEVLIDKHQITQIYHLVAMLSATGEKMPAKAWDLNMTSLINVLELAKDKKLDRIYWPSSIAIFGPNSPKDNTPQECYTDPNTIYGISKLAGERLMEYYNHKFGVDARSLRYPGLIGYKALPGGGTTDYAVDIYYKAKAGEKFNCFLSKNTFLPMMYMEDAVKATIDIMKAKPEEIKIRTSYNLSAFSFSPETQAASIRKFIPNFEIEYNPDERQKIADSWPKSIDDSRAQQDWGWKPSYTLDDMTKIMLENV